ncbi:MAG: peptidase M1, partial [Candidatus Latescibacteria bacterium]|nr:peptidase M1 [Candidatus Latescibacterota bacterium]
MYSPSKRITFSLILLCLLATGCGPNDPVPDRAPGVSWDLAQHRAKTLSDIRYELTLTVPENKEEPIVGEETIRFDRAEDGGDLVIDFMPSGDQVTDVQMDGKSVAYTVLNEHIIIPESAMQTGENSVHISFIAGNSSLNRNDEFLYTLFVPDRAHFAIPCFDQPNLKARVSLTLHIPVAWKAVANGPLAERTEAGSSATYAFDETNPISTYLIAFAAGKFETETAERNGRTMTMYHRETDAEKVQRNRETVFDLHESALNWLETYTGIPYPFKKFDFVLIPSFQYGGMEHPGAIFYRDESILHDEVATQNQKLGRAGVIAHETAHMWFGDLVTMNWFDDVWTKEVFANFMSAKIV